jgi:hypothetical protein
MDAYFGTLLDSALGIGEDESIDLFQKINKIQCLWEEA